MAAAVHITIDHKGHITVVLHLYDLEIMVFVLGTHIFFGTVAEGKDIGGSGGGKDDLAMAGGKSAENIADAFEAVKVLLKG